MARFGWKRSGGSDGGEKSVQSEAEAELRKAAEAFGMVGPPPSGWEQEPPGGPPPMGSPPHPAAADELVGADTQDAIAADVATAGDEPDGADPPSDDDATPRRVRKRPPSTSTAAGRSPVEPAGGRSAAGRQGAATRS